MNLLEQYQKQIAAELQKELKIKNPMQIPKLTKTVLNVSLGEALLDHKVIDKVIDQLAVITGQKPQVTRAKTSISTFKLRAGDKIGVKVTLRGKRMYDFFEKLVKIVLPRVRDFRGVPRKGFDNQGNYTLGIKEQIVFPEIDYAKIDKIRGLQITFVTTASTPETAQLLLTKLGIPFEKTE